jgi:hypothetical protein
MLVLKENLIRLFQIKCVLRTDLQWENMRSYELYMYIDILLYNKNETLYYFGSQIE